MFVCREFQIAMSVKLKKYDFFVYRSRRVFLVKTIIILNVIEMEDSSTWYPMS